MSSTLKLGISTWSIGTSTIDALELIDSLGFEYVEFWYYNDIKDRREEIIQLLSSYKLKPQSLHSPFTENFNIAHLNEKIRIRAIDNLTKVIEIASFYNCKYIVIHPGIGVFDSYEDYSLAKDMLVDSLKALERILEEYDMYILLENMTIHKSKFRIGTKVNELVKLIKDNSLERVGICLDTGHSNYNAIDPSIEAIEAGKLLKSLHVNDNDGFSDSHKVPGEGSINWKSFMKALKRINYNGVFLYEVYGANNAKPVLEKVLKISEVLLEEFMKS